MTKKYDEQEERVNFAVVAMVALVCIAGIIIIVLANRDSVSLLGGMI
ncbi:hypothetical protein GOV11_03730 [Candidatus Woesearchaeota archaeon]|nr:hypothetical protein [Candidatus Woesearchaeota archaeon]